MEIVEDFPPNIERIRKCFPLTGEEIFAYGDTIYSPSNVRLPPQLIEHEKVHQRQQQECGVEEWWEKYITDVSFRLEQELEAHIVEYKVYCGLHKDRNVRARYLLGISLRLSSSMYGRILTRKEAVRRIRNGE